MPGGINSPVDGLVIAEGRVKEGTLLQAKGLPYRLDELLDGDPLTPELAGARATARSTSRRRTITASTFL